MNKQPPVVRATTDVQLRQMYLPCFDGRSGFHCVHLTQPRGLVTTIFTHPRHGRILMHGPNRLDCFEKNDIRNSANSVKRIDLWGENGVMKMAQFSRQDIVLLSFPAQATLTTNHWTCVRCSTFYCHRWVFSFLSATSEPSYIQMFRKSSIFLLFLFFVDCCLRDLFAASSMYLWRVVIDVRTTGSSNSSSSSPRSAAVSGPWHTSATSDDSLCLSETRNPCCSEQQSDCCRWSQYRCVLCSSCKCRLQDAFI